MSRIKAWRLVRWDRREGAFSGEGARLFGGRWNPPGCSVVYLSEVLSLAALEVLVHEAERVPSGRFVYFEVSFPADWVCEVAREELDELWSKYPPKGKTLAIGRRWWENRESVMLRVPSILVPTEWNYLFNPLHAAAGELEVGEGRIYSFDPRFQTGRKFDRTG